MRASNPIKLPVSFAKSTVDSVICSVAGTVTTGPFRPPLVARALHPKSHRPLPWESERTPPNLTIPSFFNGLLHQKRKLPIRNMGAIKTCSYSYHYTRTDAFWRETKQIVDHG
jgi:hypothetical protein